MPRRRREPEPDFWGEFFAPFKNNAAFGPLGLTATATQKEVMAAFREKVRAASDGKGGYQGDMDALVRAKEDALKIVKERED